MNTPPYNIAVVRNLIRDAFTAGNLRRFCQDHSSFQFILPHFGPGFSFEDMIEKVIEQCQTRALLTDLLAAIREHNPRQYDRYSSQLGLVGSGQKVVNLPPLDMTHTFKDRQREIKALRDYLADERVHLVSIIGRGGWGKTALACHVLADLQKSMLLDLGEEGKHPIDGILYLGARTTGLSLERIYADVGRMLGEPAASQLAVRWTHGDTSLVVRVGYLLEAMQDGLYLILLDNLEDHLTEEGEITDEGLRCFVECGLLQPSGARLIATSRQQIRLPAAVLSRVRNIRMDEGLPENEAIALLHELDPQGRLGLSDAPQKDLQHAVRLTQGIPRALELIVGILDHDPTANLPHLLADERLFGEEVVETLVTEGYSRLRNDDRRVMEALAVFDRPVEEKAIAYLLQRWFPNLDVRHNLRRLVGSYFVSANRSSGEYNLHPLDREYAYRQLPDSDQLGIYNRHNLELRTAEFYVHIRKPEQEWGTIEDLAPQLAEFEHRVRGKDYDTACLLLNSIDPDYLHKWGHYDRLVELRERLTNEQLQPDLQANNFNALGCACADLGQVNRAIRYHEQALARFRTLGNCLGEGVSLGYLGTCYRYLGQLKRAIEYTQQALVISREIGDRRGEGEWMGNLGNAHADLGKVEQALVCYQDALIIFRDTGDRLREQIDLGNLGLAYADLGLLEAAIQHYKQALSIGSEIGYRRGEEHDLGNLGLAYADLGQLGEAIKHCEQALAISREIGDRRGESHWLGAVGIIHHGLDQTEASLDFYQQAIAIAREVGDNQRESALLGHVGFVHYTLGLFKEAVKFYEEALALAHRVGNRYTLSFCLLGLGKVFLAKGEFSGARLNCTQSLALEVVRTSHQAELSLATACLNQQDLTARKMFASAQAHCQAMLEKTSRLYVARYGLATALVGQAACNKHWVKGIRRTELLSQALGEYQHALEICAAIGVVRGALRDLESIRAAGIEGLEPVFELLNSAMLQNRARGCAIGAAIGDALGMPLEFGPRRPADQLVCDMEPGRLLAGTFTDDTEMALALADSLLAHRPLDPTDLAQRFVAWLQAGPDDVGIHTGNVLSRIAGEQPRMEAVDAVQRKNPDSAGNGSVMRCWPVALAHWDNFDQLLADSRLQSRVTHPHPECQAGSAFANVAIYYLLQGTSREEAVAQALEAVDMPAPLRAVIEQAPTHSRDELQNSGWVRHTLESAVWGLLTTDTFEDAVVQVVNLGNDADTVGAVVGALAGAAYGIDAIPLRWREALQGEWPLGSGTHWRAGTLIELADRLTGIDVCAPPQLNNSEEETGTP